MSFLVGQDARLKGLGEDSESPHGKVGDSKNHLKVGGHTKKDGIGDFLMS